ncbi:MAG: FKBP-type peptidyl-prolyl cis-trans isomerase [Bacteroidales bacterium]|nr:FKBP-type peptidyl-prolyl cis-trans isomerase [Bacteroidales bacterium]
MIIRTLVITFSLMLVLSCSPGSQRAEQERTPGKRELADLNRYLVRKDRERIENYIERRNLDMTETRSGLWYMIESEGTGKNLSDNDRVLLEFECTLLDGTFCYSSKEEGPREVVVGRSRIEPGLDQGLRMLKPGGKALFIIPPFLGWGLPGDGKKIPSRAVIVYKVKVIDVK